MSTSNGSQLFLRCSIGERTKNHLPGIETAFLLHQHQKLATMGKNFRVSASRRLTRVRKVKTLTLCAQGKNRRRDGGGGRGGGQQGNGGRDGGGRPGYTSYPAIAKNNEKLQEYYDGLLQLPEDEKKLFWDALKRELPNSFRFCGSKGCVASPQPLGQLTDFVQARSHRKATPANQIHSRNHQDGALGRPPDRPARTRSLVPR